MIVHAIAPAISMQSKRPCNSHYSSNASVFAPFTTCGAGYRRYAVSPHSWRSRKGCKSLFAQTITGLHAKPGRRAIRDPSPIVTIWTQRGRHASPRSQGRQPRARTRQRKRDQRCAIGCRSYCRTSFRRWAETVREPERLTPVREPERQASEPVRAWRLAFSPRPFSQASLSWRPSS